MKTNHTKVAVLMVFFTLEMSQKSFQQPSSDWFISIIYDYVNYIQLLLVLL